jgi:hypothetical protein
MYIVYDITQQQVDVWVGSEEFRDVRGNVKSRPTERVPGQVMVVRGKGGVHHHYQHHHHHHHHRR